MSDSCTSARNAFGSYLQAADGRGSHAALHTHLAGCPGCRAAWNHYRWDHAADSALLEELQDFLGADYTPYRDSSAELAATWRRADPQTPDEVAAFFRSSTAYLYNLIIWQASGNRPDYCAAAVPILRAQKVRTVVGYGCGIGNDTVPLLDAGFTVTGCDYDSPSTRFLRWRLRRHGHDAVVAEPAALPCDATYDALWTIDTLDHLPDIDAALGPLLQRVRLVVCENLAVQRGVSGKIPPPPPRRGHRRDVHPLRVASAARPHRRDGDDLDPCRIYGSRT
ncbi:class I SAM-dependent methyltransferase [Streptosporangium sandarakinum]|uniref:class I SAM-dependent methyltransferase n=1 Tax=Streptosporangium sandarakinum TaxID=1260955 RepID=UPI0033A41D44